MTPDILWNGFKGMRKNERDALLQTFIDLSDQYGFDRKFWGVVNATEER